MSVLIHVKGMVLPCASHPGEIAIMSSIRLRSTLAAAPFLFAHSLDTRAERKEPWFCSPCVRQLYMYSLQDVTRVSHCLLHAFQIVVVVDLLHVPMVVAYVEVTEVRHSVLVYS